MAEFRINIYYLLYRDKSITSSRIFKEYLKIKHNENDLIVTSEIYSKISKYQVRKYGNNLCRFSGLVRSIKEI